MQHKEARPTEDGVGVVSLNRGSNRPGAPIWGFSRSRERSRQTRVLSLALQGGAAFGAFTWGVLDRLLEEGAIAFDMISGTSAGAINAIALADGLATGGPAAARDKLERIWRRISNSAPMAPLGSFGRTAIGSAASASMEISSRLFSPYQLNPFGINPLRDILSAEIDFERLRRVTPVRLLIAATRVSDGELRLFREHEISLEAVLASSCLPFLHHAVEIDGEAYWDGGFSANPPLRQLVIDSDVDDIVLVQTLPEMNAGVPRNVSEIARRVGQIAFSNPLRKEEEALADLTKLCREQGLFQSRLCRKLDRLRLHRISADKAAKGLDPASALNLDWRFLTGVREFGRVAAQEWLAPTDA